MSAKTVFVQPAVYQRLPQDLRSRLIEALGGKDQIVDRYAAGIVSDLQDRGENTLAEELLEVLPEVADLRRTRPPWHMGREKGPALRYAVEMRDNGSTVDDYYVSKHPCDTPMGSVVVDGTQVRVFGLTWSGPEGIENSPDGMEAQAKTVYSGTIKDLASERSPMLRAVYEQLKRDLSG